MSVFKLLISTLTLDSLVIFAILHIIRLDYLLYIHQKDELLVSITVVVGLLFVNLVFVVSQREGERVTNLYYLLVPLFASLFSAFVLLSFWFNLSASIREIEGFTKKSGLLAEVTPIVKHGHEGDQIIICILSGKDYCTKLNVSQVSFYEPYSVCNIVGDLFYKDKKYITKYDVLRKTFLTSFDVQISCISKGGLLSAIFKTREKISEDIKKVIPQPQSTLLTGIIFGIDQSYDDDFARSIKSAGLSHIVAASGYNVTILVNSIDKALFFVSKKWRDIISILFIWVYALLTGFASSMVRASTMSSILILSKVLKLKIDTKDVFKLTFVALIFINPATVFDIGFQLSIASTFGLIWVSPILEKVKIIKTISATTISCILTTLPITIVNFQTLSPYTLIANILVLPVVEIAMILGILGIILKPLLYIVWGNLKYVEIVSRIVDSFPFSQVQLSPVVSPFISITLFFLIVIILFKNKNERADTINIT